MHRRIDIAEFPLVGRQLSIGRFVPFPQEERELLFCEIRIDQRERDGVERQVPGREPWIFPLVRHGEHVIVVYVNPVSIPALLALRRRRRHGGIAFQPFFDDVMVELLGPQQSRQRLALDHPGVVG